jgi:dienelactone hydrolase
VRTRIIADDPKFAVHVVFYGAAEFQYRDRATDRSPMLFFHGEADNYVPVGPTREFADWAQSMGNPVSLVAYPGTYHDFDVEGGFHGFARSLEVGAKCDLAMDLTDGHVLRMDHKDNPGVGPEAVRGYARSCFTHGANLAYNAAARADAAEKLHAFLRHYLGAAG